MARAGPYVRQRRFQMCCTGGEYGGEYNILFATDCARLKKLRQTLTRFLSRQNSLEYVPVQAAESTILLHDLMARPEVNFGPDTMVSIYFAQDFSDSIRRYSHSLAKSLDELVHALAPGAYPPFDLLPVLKYSPPAFAPWCTVGRRVASARTAAGDEESYKCFIGKIVQTGSPIEEEEFYSYTGLALLDAGSDTTAAFLLSLVLVLAVNPECQKRVPEASPHGIQHSYRERALARFRRFPASTISTLW
ncbi:hypothetical protein C8R47DRAFT_1067069 [Mycena vitilis]|nr:hypothetical protein C8R47DRAFT_1067069 [Mycena vitilis]